MPLAGRSGRNRPARLSPRQWHVQLGLRDRDAQPDPRPETPPRRRGRLWHVVAGHPERFVAQRPRFWWRNRRVHHYCPLRRRADGKLHAARHLHPAPTGRAAEGKRYPVRRLRPHRPHRQRRQLSDSGGASASGHRASSAISTTFPFPSNMAAATSPTQNSVCSRPRRICFRRSWHSTPSSRFC